MNDMNLALEGNDGRTEIPDWLTLEVYRQLSKDYHEQRDRMIDLEGTLREVIQLLEIVPQITYLDAQEVWKGQTQDVGRHAKELLEM